MSPEQAERSDAVSLGGETAAQAARNYKDIVGGLAVIAIAGLFIIISSGYGLGTPRRMGAGFFPLVLGILLAVIGFFIVLVGRNGSGSLPRISVRPAVSVFSSIAFFAFSLERFGMIPSVCGAVAIAALSSRKPKIHRIVILAIVVSFASWLIFIYGLTLPLSAVRMP